jgi:hypothetical protein
LDAAGKFYAVPTADVSLHANRYSYTTLSVEYVHDLWTLAAEYQRDAGTFNVITPFFNTGSPGHIDRWYVSAARRLSDKIEVGAYYAVQQNGTPAAGSLDVDNHNRDSALSLKYDFNEHVVFKIEGHAIDGRYNMFNTAKTPNPVLKGSTTYIVVKTTLSF